MKMGIDLQSLYSLADGVEEPQSQPERHQAQWAQWNLGLGLARKIGFPEIVREHNLKQQGTLPTLELSEEPKRMPYLEDESTRYSDGTPKPARFLKR